MNYAGDLWQWAEAGTAEQKGIGDMLFYGLITALAIALACFVASWPAQRKSLAEYAAREGGMRKRTGERVPVRGREGSVRQGMPVGGQIFARQRAPFCGGYGMTRQRALSLLCLAGIFVLLAGVAALRIEVGNDYGKYVDIFHEIYAGTDSAYVVTEPGFNFVVKAVYILSGYENYLLVFALFGAATAFVFLKAMYEQSADFKVSLAMFLLLGIYFRTFTTVRYYFVLALTLYSLKYVKNREFGKFFLLILFASLFHKSVLVVLVFYPLAHFSWKKRMVVGGGILAAGAFLFQKQILALALQLYPTFRDTVYLTQGIGLSANASGILRCLFVFLLSAICWRESVKENPENRFYLKLSVLGFLLYTCGSFLPLVSRLAYYVVTPQILLVPGLLEGLWAQEKAENGGNASEKRRCAGIGRKRILITALTAFFCLGYFFWFLKIASGNGINVLPYRTWIFTDKEWINGSDLF